MDYPAYHSSMLPRDVLRIALRRLLDKIEYEDGVHPPRFKTPTRRLRIEFKLLCFTNKAIVDIWVWEGDQIVACWLNKPFLIKAWDI